MTPSDVAEYAPHILTIVGDSPERRAVAAAILDAARVAADHFDTDTAEMLIVVARYYADRQTRAALEVVATLALMLQNALDGTAAMAETWAGSFPKVVAALSADVDDNLRNPPGAEFV
jgi:hypothetical protein